MSTPGLLENLKPHDVSVVNEPLDELTYIDWNSQNSGSSLVAPQFYDPLEAAFEKLEEQIKADLCDDRDVVMLPAVLPPRSVVHITLGIADMGDGSPWIPSWHELRDAHMMWTEALPDDVTVVVTHFGHQISAIMAPDDGDTERT
jgi:hypothetical protein